jgi:FtsH-binding integral membrane protein
MEEVTTIRDRLAVENTFLRQVYNWMFLGLAATAAISLIVSSSPSLAKTISGNTALFIGLVVIELAMVIGLSAGINRMSTSTAILMFFVYSAFNGLTLSIVFLVFTSASIASTFFITAGTFAVVSIYGYTTKRDLTSLGHFLFMGLIGIILASVVNFFLHSRSLYWLITYIGVIVFVGLTARDTQRLKLMATSGSGDGEAGSKNAVIGALALYLDFINMFLFLLRIFGRRR